MARTLGSPGRGYGPRIEREGIGETPAGADVAGADVQDGALIRCGPVSIPLRLLPRACGLPRAGRAGPRQGGRPRGRSFPACAPGREAQAARGGRRAGARLWLMTVAVIRGGPGGAVIRGAPGGAVIRGAPGGALIRGAPGGALIRGAPGGAVIRGAPGGALIRGAPGGATLVPIRLPCARIRPIPAKVCKGRIKVFARYIGGFQGLAARGAELLGRCRTCP